MKNIKPMIFPFSKLFILLYFLQQINCYIEYMPSDIKSPITGYFISDPNHYLTNQDLEEINKNLINIQKLQVGVLLIDKISSIFLDRYINQDEAAQQFAKVVFDNWGIGDARTNNGVLIFMSIKDRKFRLVTGQGAQEYVGDYNCNLIFEDVKPYLKAGEYKEAVNKAIEGVKYYIDPPPILTRIYNLIVQLITVMIVPLIVIFALLCFTCINQLRPINRKRADFTKKIEKLKNLQINGKLNEQFINSTCGICLQEYEKTDTQDPKNANYVILVCGHNFHKECLESWLKTKNMCPFCKLQDPTNPNRSEIHNDEADKLNQNSNDMGLGNNHSDVLHRMLFIQRNRYPEFYNDYSFTFQDHSFMYRDVRVRSNGSSKSGSGFSFGGGSSRGGGGGGGSW